MANPSRVGSAALAAASVLVAASSVPGQVLPIGPDRQVNAFTTGRQAAPRIARLADGEFVVGWCCGEGPTAVTRRLSPAGEPVGPEMPVDADGAGRPRGIAALPGGDFVVVWGEGGPGPGGGSPRSGFGRRFGSGGEPLGPTFQVNESEPSEYFQTGGVAGHANGEFVVVWDEYGGWARRYAADGTPHGSGFELAGGYPRVAPTPGGGFVVAWQGGLFAVEAQRFDADGEPTGPRLPVTVPGSSRDIDIATGPAGAFAVAWDRGSDVFARRFGPSGGATGPEFRVHDDPTGSQSYPAVHVQPSGEFVVAWSEYYGPPGPDPSASRVRARRFAPDATPLGPAFAVNTQTDGYQFAPRVAGDGDRLVIVWTSASSAGSDTSDLSVQSRVFLTPFFMDGLENGGTARWSETQP